MMIDKLMRRDVRTLGPCNTCTEAAVLMRNEDIGSVVVTEHGRVLGMVTDRDLVDRVMAAGKQPENVKLREIMTEEPAFVMEERDLEEVLDSMRRLRIRRVVIVDHDGELCGIVSMDDLLLYFSAQLDAIAEVVRGAITVPART